MKLKTNIISVSAICAVMVFASCNKMETKPSDALTESSQSSLQDKISENGTNPDEAIFSKSDSINATNYFYIESNKKSKNTILAFSQNSNGQLILNDEVTSGGYGYGQALGSQGALAVSKEYNLLFAVNPGSNSISSFRINAATGGLKLLFTVNSNASCQIVLRYTRINYTF